MDLAAHAAQTLIKVAEVQALRRGVLDARAAFDASRRGSRSQYDAAFATLCKASVRYNRARTALLEALGLADA